MTLNQFVVIVIGSLVLANVFGAILLTLPYRRMFYALRSRVRGMTKEDWQMIRGCADALTVAVGLAAVL